MDGSCSGGVEGGSSAAGRDHADSKPTATRKRRNRSGGGSGSEESPELPDIQHVPKKRSTSDMEVAPTGKAVDRVALLDAGAQYGKVNRSYILMEDAPYCL